MQYIDQTEFRKVQFEDNAGVLITPEGEMKGTDIKGPVASGSYRKMAK